jgi:ketosteroid isomerase-like protein
MADTTVGTAPSTQESAAKSTEAVLDHHLQAFGAGDLSGLLEDYTDESVIITPDGVLRGPAQITPLFQAFLAEFAKPGASFHLDRRVIEEETAYITWSAETADSVYQFATDTFWVHDGKILMQTFAAKVDPK